MKEQIKYPGSQRNLFLIVTAFALLLMFLQRYLNAGLVTPEAPQHIVSLELAKTPKQALKVLNSWAQKPYGETGEKNGIEVIVHQLYRNIKAFLQQLMKQNTIS